MFEREYRRLSGLIKTDHPDSSRLTRQLIFNQAERHQRIRRGAQANVPDDEFTRRFPSAFRQALLPDIQGFGFGRRSDSRMKCFVGCQRMNRAGAVAQMDQAITAFLSSEGRATRVPILAH